MSVHCTANKVLLSMEAELETNMNATNITDSELNEERRNLLMPVTILLAVTILTGVVGNLFVVFIYGRRYCTTSAIFFIVAIGLSQLASCCLLSFEIYSFVTPLLNHGLVLCNIVRFLQIFVGTYCILIVVCLAIDRARIVLKPSKMMTVKEAKALVIVMFFLALALTWPRQFLRVKKGQSVESEEIRNGCNVSYLRSGTLYALLYECVLYLTFGIIAVVCIILYSLIAVKICHRRHVSSKDSYRSSLRRKKFERMLISRALESMKVGLINEEKTESKVRLNHGRFTIIAGVLTFITLASYLPYLCVTILRYTGRSFVTLPPTDMLLYELCANFYFLNNMFSPLIYCFLDPNYRIEVIKCMKSREKDK